ncbi:PadR family transcriptional regulator [Paenibacillus nanensis]|uniref:PadR family transcriptional regulator n=1 Tax=Paenibacillus nanensis TaxID=393251 RepID=A0A3A1UXY6_9BACL|nr:PadR family transcriptional regulator [Paenibacillus nanensis]RIX53144.1 PadR family transcriptional regulator [Paenibacillus nanensis]
MSGGWKAEEQLFLTHGPGREQSSSGRRFFMRGGVKYALLELLAEESMHGYEMMKRLEEQSGGTYKPSPGSIYPTLQMLRDQGFVASHKQSDGKKIFSITEEGRAFLLEEPAADSRESEGRGRGAEPGADEEQLQGELRSEGGRNRRLTPAGKELLHLLKAAERAAMEDAAKAAKLRSILMELKINLREMTEEKRHDE